MGPLPSALRDVIGLFDDFGTDYVLMGGLAARALGIPRPTYDIDFTIAIEREKLPDLYGRLDEAGYTVPEPYWNGWVDEVSGLPLVRFRLYLEGLGIDVDIFLAETEYQEEVLRRRVRADAEGLLVWLVTPEDLILLKLMANRPRDFADILDVRFMQSDLDETYMRRWAEQLGITDRLERALSEPL